MIISKIIQNGLDLSIETNNIPFQYSANQKIQFVRDDEYSNWTLQGYARLPQVSLLESEDVTLVIDENDCVNLSPIFFKRNGKLRLSFSLAGNENEIIHLGIVEYLIRKSIGDTDTTLPDDEEVWIEYVHTEMNNYFERNYAGKLEEFTKQSEEMTKLHNDSVEFIKSSQNTIEQDIANFEKQTDDTIIQAKTDLRDLSNELMDSKVDKEDGKSLIQESDIERIGTIDQRVTKLEIDGVTSGDTLPVGSIVEWENDLPIPTGWEEVEQKHTEITIDDKAQAKLKMNTTRDSATNKVKVQILDTQGNAVMVETTSDQVYTSDGLALDTILNSCIFVLEENNGITHCGDYERFVQFLQNPDSSDNTGSSDGDSSSSESTSTDSNTTDDINSTESNSDNTEE